MLSYNALIKVYRRMIVNLIVPFDINIITITPREYDSRFQMHWFDLGAAAKAPNSFEICTF
jgi:hypothetical protein